MRTLADVLIFVAILFALFVAFMMGERDFSWRHPLTWILPVAGTYAYARLLKWIYAAKPRWQVEREAQKRTEPNASK